MRDSQNSEAYTLGRMKSQRVRPLKAWRHFQNLIANKEDTEQVFHIINDLNGNSQKKIFETFVNTEIGRMRLSENVYLPPLLDNHEHLKTLPKGSLGRAYLEFMLAEGLTAQGLVDEYDRFGTKLKDELPQEVQWYFNRRRDTHDMLHILTGYGRDALGEASLLAFTYAQYNGLGVAFIAYGAGFEVRKTAPKKAKIMQAIHEGYKNGKAARDLLDHNIMDILKEPLEDIRKTLNINPPLAYRRAHKIIRAHGMDPYDMIKPSETVTNHKNKLAA